MNKFRFLAFILILICLGFFSDKAMGQTINKTEIVLFDSSRFEYKYLYDNSKDIKTNEYIFRLYDSKKTPYSKESIRFVYKKYKDFDEMERDNPVPKFAVNKRFLKNNKGKILTIKKMQQMGYEKSLNLFLKAKHIFLIDMSESENGQIVLKEVFLSYIGEE